MHNKADIIVIGAGLMGLSSAYYLSKKGLRVLVAEQGPGILDGSSGATDGYIMHNSKIPGYHSQIGCLGSDMYPGLLAELGDNCDYEPDCGGYLICEDDRTFAAMCPIVEKQRAGGMDIQMIDGYELRQLEPELSPHLRGATYTPGSSKVEPIKLGCAMARSGKRQGVQFIFNAPVTEVLVEKGRAAGVRTPAGVYYADHVVNAVGSWAGIVAEAAGLYAPVKPRRGQIVVTEAVAPMIRGVMTSAGFMAMKFYPDMLDCFSEQSKKLGHGFAIEQTNEGTILLSFTNEFAGFDKSTTMEAIELLIKEACKFVPGLRDMHFIRTFAGFRPYTPDNLPMIGPTTHLEGFYFAAGHEGGGLALTPITGLLISEIICGEEPSITWQPLAPDRLVKPLAG